MLMGTLLKIPGCPFAFLKYLWSSLVLPVFTYGLEVFDIDSSDLQASCQTELRTWKRLLKLGGRSPNDAVH
eukprot:1569295-Karenia_brevis.AAC.1